MVDLYYPIGHQWNIVPGWLFGPFSVNWSHKMGLFRQSWKKCFDSLVTWEEAKKLAAKRVIFDTSELLKYACFLTFLALKLIFSTVPSKIRVIFSRYIKQISFCRFFYKYDNILQWFQNFLLKKGAKYRGLPKTLCEQNLSLVTRLQGYATFSYSRIKSHKQG